MFLIKDEKEFTYIWSKLEFYLIDTSSKKEEGYSFEEIKCFMKCSMKKEKLPKIYGLFKEKEIIGMYQFSYEDLDCRLIYIDERYRNQGYIRNLLESVKENALKDISFDEIFCTQKKFIFMKHLILNLYLK